MKSTTYLLGRHPEASSLLDRLGITRDELEAAVRLGEYGRDNTDNVLHPPSYPGTVAWADTLRGLAVILRPKGWTRCEVRGGLSVVMSPDGLDSIAVQTGDENTGNLNATPTTKYPRGEATVKVVEQNAQLAFGFEGVMPARARRIIVAGGFRTWFFMRYRPEGLKAVIAELSLPKVITDEGKVEDWEPRIVLPLIDVSGGPETERRRDADDGDSGSIDVPVGRK